MDLIKKIHSMLLQSSSSLFHHHTLYVVQSIALRQSEERRMTLFVSPQLFLRPKRSNAVVEATNKLLNSPVNHHEVIHHTPVGGGESRGGGAVDAAFGTNGLSFELLEMLQEMRSQFVVSLCQRNETEAALNRD